MPKFLSKAKRGFTLIELLVVIAIIGVLASIVLASLNTARTKSRDARRIADAKQIQLALELYFDAFSGQYPAAIYAGALAPTYIPVVPLDPTGGTQQYAYFMCTGGTAYHLGVGLEDQNNPALDGDRDAGCAGTTLTGAADGGGATQSTAGCLTGAGRYCYDLTN